MRNSITTSRSWNVLTAVLVMLLANVNANAQSGGAIYEVGPDMMRAKIVPGASQLENGNVISFGDREAGFVPFAYADIYNPATKSFSVIPLKMDYV